jgi:hypothetical protein
MVDDNHIERDSLRFELKARGVVIRLRLWWFAAFDALSVTTALIGPLLFARLRRPISLLRLPA